MFRKLAPCTKGYRLYMLLSPLMVVGEVLLEIQIPRLMAEIVDKAVPAQDLSMVLKVGGSMLLMALCSLVFGVLAAKFSSTAGMGFGANLRRTLFHKVQEFSFANLDRFSTPSLVTRLTTDVNNLQNTFMMMIRVMVRSPVMLISATYVAYTINAELVKVFLIAIPILAGTLIAVARITYPRFGKMLKCFDAVNASVQENLAGIRVVKAFVRADYEKKKFYDTSERLLQASLRAERVLAFNQPAMQIAMYSCIIAVLWFGGNMVITGTMQTGELISFVTYVTQILMSLMMLTMVMVNLVLSRASVARMAEVMDEVADIADGGSDLVPEDGSVEFRDVSFRYATGADEDILSDINLRIESGMMVGIIGGTGSAKTTLVQLISRLYDVKEGQVLVGGHDVREYRLQTLRSAVSMVLQKNVLFSGTIRDNLKWGKEDATDEELCEVCRAAQAHDFITAFPDGYDTVLGQGGVNVSGGQKQRLCIARALLTQPKILILDDSTSAVDTATDQKIREALANELAGSTKIIIAQRITSVCEADRIVVLDDGKISAVGTHEELMKKSEIYREVYDSQQKGVTQ